MTNEILTVAAGEIARASDVPQNVHTGSGDIYSNIGTIYQITNYPGTEPYYPDEIDTRYFNLVVVEKQPFTGTIAIPKNKALKESISSDVWEVFGKCGDEEREKIYKLPSIFATRNRNGRSTEDGHMAMYGFIKNISIQGDLLIIKHSMNLQIVQQELNKIEDALQLDYAPDSNELDKVHWTIKEVNLRRIIGV